MRKPSPRTVAHYLTLRCGQPFDSEDQDENDECRICGGGCRARQMNAEGRALPVATPSVQYLVARVEPGHPGPQLRIERLRKIRVPPTKRVLHDVASCHASAADLLPVECRIRS